MPFPVDDSSDKALLTEQGLSYASPIPPEAGIYIKNA